MEFWEAFFSKHGAIFEYAPADSALYARDLFLKEGFRTVLIPGFGYGRNAGPFLDAGFDLTGIEISGSALELARKQGIRARMQEGSVTAMPFDDEVYDGIYCYALLHLLNSVERRTFLQACHRQLRPGGIMVFVVACVRTESYGRGKILSRNRFSPEKGLQVFYYDEQAIAREFGPFGIIEDRDIEEPIRFKENHEPLALRLIVCRKPTL